MCTLRLEKEVVRITANLCTCASCSRVLPEFPGKNHACIEQPLSIFAHHLPESLHLTGVHLGENEFATALIGTLQLLVLHH